MFSPPNICEKFPSALFKKPLEIKVNCPEAVFDFPLTIEEANMLKEWMCQYPQIFNVDSIIIPECDKSFGYISIKQGISTNIYLHRDNELAEFYDLPFFVIGYEI